MDKRADPLLISVEIQDEAADMQKKKTADVWNGLVPCKFGKSVKFFLKKHTMSLFDG